MRRVGSCFLELDRRPALDLAALLARASFEVLHADRVRVHRPPRTEPIELDAAEAALLVTLPCVEWCEAATLPHAALARLLALGLAEGADAAHAPAPAAPPLDDWFGPAALYHFASRWQGVTAREDLPTDAAAAAASFAASSEAFAQDARKRGAPPPARHARGDDATAHDLPAPPVDAFDALLMRRETHRRFDATRPVTLAQLGGLLQRCLGALGHAPLGGGQEAVRKHAPSGGGLHPVEGYVLAANVAGLAPGWYHYRAHQHRLAPLATFEAGEARRRIVAASAGQAYFRDAALLLALTLRFPRHHWKYPRHAKAYRVMLLDAGHVAQLFALAATQAGLGPFVTAAINEVDLDRELGLDGIEEGSVLLLGCGVPAEDGAALRLSHYIRTG